MARTPQEAFHHHGQALGAGDPDEIVGDFADDAVFISPSGVLRGKDGFRAAASAAHSTKRMSPSKIRVRYTVRHKG